MLKKTTGPWIDFPTFRSNVAPTGTNDWFAARRGLLTASNFDKVCPGSNFKIEKNKPANPAMLRGIRLEPIAREWYVTTQKKIVQDIGFAVPKWDPRIGGASDGYIEDDPQGPGILEIKCPEKMYSFLSQHSQALLAGEQFPPFYHGHIWSSHYSQMQGCMKIMNVDWCDYVVYCATDKEDSPSVYLERIPFNGEYWDNWLAPAIETYFRNKK